MFVEIEKNNLQSSYSIINYNTSVCTQDIARGRAPLAQRKAKFIRETIISNVTVVHPVHSCEILADEEHNVIMEGWGERERDRQKE